VIRYRLQCANSHEFEAWFASSASYDVQAAGAQITCPECNTREVGKSIMAPNVALRPRAEPAAAAADETPTRYRNLVRQMRKLLVEGSENVGDRFPEEARKIHYREVEARSILGTASHDEVRELIEEGIEILPVPRLPEDTN